jgi:hypothetical protein
MTTHEPCACLAHQIQKIIAGRPSKNAFIKIVENNLLPKNCHITKSDIFALADDILLLP